MQSWELERELGKAQDKLEAIKGEVILYRNRTRRNWRTGYMTVVAIEKILEDHSSGE